MRFIQLLFVLFICANASGQNINLSNRAFMENKGQILSQYDTPNNNLLYLYSEKGIQVQLRKTGYSYELFSVINPKQINSVRKTCDHNNNKNIELQSSRVDIDFMGMNSDVEIINSEPSNSLINYIKPGSEIYGIKSYKKITYKNVYNNIDIEFTLSSEGNNPLKYNIILHPGADINQIKFLCQGASSIFKKSNEIKISTALGEITERIPLSYYTHSPQENIPVEFSLNNNVFSFRANYDKSKTLVIDPSSNIIWGTYFGGTGLEFTNATGTDSQNNVYITGHTVSSSNIATVGSYQNTIGGNQDIFLAKFTPGGNIIWATYYGGSGNEFGNGIFVEANGTVYVCGDSSTGAGMASPGAHQTIYGGGLDDALLIKFNSSGQRLWATYYGGTEHDFGNSMTVDLNGNVIVAGHTRSANTGNCMATPGSYSSVFSFLDDAFVVKFNSSGVRLWGTYYGETFTEEALAVATDTGGNVIITGFTNSMANIATPGGHQPFFGGSIDAFLAKFDPSGANLIWGTYYGGAADDQGFAVETNTLGEIFLAGYTASGNNISTLGSYQFSNGGSEDGFIARFDAAGQRIWGTFYGGTGSEYIYDVLVDPLMNIVMCGQTTSSSSISTADAYQPSIGLASTNDAFFAKFTIAGNRVLASYYGSSAEDFGKGIALDNTGKLYLCGESTSTIGLTTVGAYQVNSAGSQDGFLAKFCLSPKPLISPAGTPSICLNDTYTLVASPGFTNYFWNLGQTTSSIVIGFLPQGDHYYTVTVFDAFGCSGTSDSAKVVVQNCLTDLHENFDEDKTQIYPIPANNYLIIQHSVPIKNNSVEIYSSIGQFIEHCDLEGNPGKINLSKLSTGMYFLKYNQDDKTIVRKFLKN